MGEPEVLRNTGMEDGTGCTGFLARTTIEPGTKAGLGETESIVVRRPSLEWNFHAGGIQVDPLRTTVRISLSHLIRGTH